MDTEKKTSAKKAVAKKSPGKKAPAKKPSAKRAAGPSTKTAAAKKSPAKASKKEPEKDPQGGLTAAGRKAFAQRDGSHLRPGVTGSADTAEKQKRKGSFLRRHFANPRGPMEHEGEPTRLALSAHAWGEPVPQTAADAKKLAAKGGQLLDKFHASADKAADPPKAAKAPAKKKQAKPPDRARAK